MNTLAKRISAIEQLRPNIDSLTEDELQAYAGTLQPGSSEQVGAVVALVCRRGSTLPIIRMDPETLLRPGVQ